MAKKKLKKSKAKGKKGKKKKGGSSSLIVLIVAVALIAGVFLYSKISSGEAAKFIKADRLAEWGNPGDKKGQLNSPRGIAVAPDGSAVYVTIMNNAAVGKFTPDGELLAYWGGKGAKPGEFNEPSGMSIDPQGNIYVADAWNGRIQKFDPKGKFIMEIGGTKAGFYSPRNVAVNKTGMMCVADTGTSRLHRYDTEGNKIGGPVGGSGRSPGKFGEVFGIAFDSKGRIYAADPGNRRIQVFTSDLVPAGQIKVKAWDNAFPLWPMLAMDSSDRLYAVSSGTQEILVWDTKAKTPKLLGSIKNDRNGKPLFSNPLGIAIDPQENIYVTEISRNKVMKIRPVFDQQ